MKPTRCCVQTLKGTRCANEPSPVRSTRMIGPVEIAACGLDGHQRAMRSLPDFVRHDAYCGAVGCDQASNAGICKKHRDMYRDFGITEHMLLAQEAPMTEPAPAAPPVTPYDMLDAAAKVWFAMPQEERDACLVAISVATISTGESAPMPPAAPQDAAGGVTTQSGGYLACITPGCGDEDLMDLDQTTGLCGMCSRQQVRESKERDYEDNYVPVSEPVPAEAALKRLTSTVDAPHLPVAFAPVDAVDSFAADDKPSVVAHIAAITKIERDLRTRRDAVATRLISAGFEMEYGTLQTTAYRKGDLLVSLPMDDRGLSLSEFERRVVGAEVVAPTAIISALLKDAAEMATAEPPSAEAVAGFLLTPKPPAKVTEADFEPLHPLEARRASLIARLYMAGFVKVDSPAEYLWRFNGPNGAVLIPVGHPCEVERDFADMLDHAEKECAKVEAAAMPADTVEPSADGDAPLFVGGTDSAPMQQRREAVVARLLALGAEEQPGRHPTARVFALKYEAYIVPDVSYSAKDMDAAMQSVERACDRLESFMAGRWSQKHTALPMSTPTLPPEPTDLAALAARGQQPTAPGPTVADLQQQLAATRDALTRIASQLASVGLWAEVAQSPAPEVDGVGLLTTRYLVERERADAAQHQLREAVAELAAIAALLDPEDAPAYDSDDQPIPLPTRVQTALMPSKPSAREKRLQEAVDAYSQQLSDVDDVLHWLGAYGTINTVDRLMKVLTPEDRRNILELRAAIVREDIARLKARRLSPPPCGRMEEHAADLAAIEAKIAALPSLPPSTTPLAMEVR